MMKGARWSYLAKEGALILGLSYALLLGGTYNGLIFFQFRLISLVLLGAGGALWLSLCVLRGRRIRTPLDWPLLALLLAYSLAALVSSDPRRSLTAVWLLGLAVWAYWLASDLLGNGWTAGLWAKSLLAVGTVVVGLALSIIVRWYLHWLSIAGQSDPIPPAVLRIWSLPGHPNFIAAMLNLLWPFALAQAAAPRRWSDRAVLSLWTLSAWVVIFFTSSRGGWLGTAAALACLGALWVLDRGGWSWVGRAWQSLRSRPALMAGSAIAIMVVVTAAAVVVWPQLSHPSHRPALESRREFWAPAIDAFTSRPLTGMGPFTYEMAFNRAVMNSVPTKSVFTHAHSLFLTIMAEAGLVGAVALGVAMIVAARGLVISWRGSRRGSRAALMGAIAALTSAAVHGFFDTVQMMPTLAMLLAIVGAIALYRPGARPPGRGWAAPVLWLLLVCLGGWSLWGYGPGSAGVAAGNMGDWEAAVPLLETAAERDPALAINQFHAGYAHGVLSMKDPAHLEPAITYFREGITHDPDYAPHHANLAALLWAAGQEEEAIAEMGAAVELAPRAAVFHLNLGDYYAEMGRTDRAVAAYSEAMELGRWQSVQFWESTPIRALALERVGARSPTDADEGWAALERGELSQARSQFESQLSRQPNSVAAYRGLAAVALAEGDRAAARRNLQVALFIGSTYSPEEHLRAQMDWARLAAVEGELEQAVSRAAPVLDAFRRQTFWGVGRFGTADYGWYVYYRESFLSDMLPQVVTIRMPDEAAEWTLEVAGWQGQVGRVQEALALCQEVLEAIPDSAGAQACVDGLAR